VDGEGEHTVAYSPDELQRRQKPLGALVDGALDGGWSERLSITEKALRKAVEDKSEKTAKAAQARPSRKRQFVVSRPHEGPYKPRLVAHLKSKNVPSATMKKSVADLEELGKGTVGWAAWLKVNKSDSTSSEKAKRGSVTKELTTEKKAKKGSEGKQAPAEKKAKKGSTTKDVTREKVSKKGSAGKKSPEEKKPKKGSVAKEAPTKKTANKSGKKANTKRAREEETTAPQGSKKQRKKKEDSLGSVEKKAPSVANKKQKEKAVEEVTTHATHNNPYTLI
jgi:hypothetical protein